MQLLSHHVDTFKESLYLSGDCDNYNLFVDGLMNSKEIAQTVHDMNNANRFIDVDFGGNKWQVMATSVTGYSVVIKNGDVSIAFAKRLNVMSNRNPSVKIEYRAQFLVNYGLHGAHKKVNEFFKAYVHGDYLSKVQEIHLACDVQGHRFNLFDTYRMKTRARKMESFDGDDGEIGRKMVFTSRRLETLYFGTGSNMLRIYNKTAEAKKHPDSMHVEKLWKLKNPKGYDENKDVWRIEFQIRREKLKNIFTLDQSLPYDHTLVLLDNVGGLWDFFINYFSYRDIKEDMAIDLIKGYWTRKNGDEVLYTKKAESRIFEKSDIHPLWNLIEKYDNVEPPQYFRFIQVKQTDPVYALNAVCGSVSTIIKHFGEFTEDTFKKVVEMADNRCIQNNDLGLIDHNLKKLPDYFAKIEKQRKLGLDVITIDDDVKDNLAFYLADPMARLITTTLHKPSF